MELVQARITTRDVTMAAHVTTAVPTATRRARSHSRAKSAVRTDDAAQATPPEHATNTSE